jgi:hypothetical protein
LLNAANTNIKFFIGDFLMKQCPKCNRTYDDSQSFCLMDGTSLTIESEEETIVRRQSPAPIKSRFLLWLGLAGLVILVGGAAVAGFVIYKFSRPEESMQAKRQNDVNISSSPTLPSTPKVSPTPPSFSSVSSKPMPVVRSLASKSRLFIVSLFVR